MNRIRQISRRPISELSQKFLSAQMKFIQVYYKAFIAPVVERFTYISFPGPYLVHFLKVCKNLLFDVFHNSLLLHQRFFRLHIPVMFKSEM